MTKRQGAAQQPHDLMPNEADGADEPARRRRGRPKGYPKTGGRRKATAPDGQSDAASAPPCTCGGRYASHDPLRADAQYSRAIADEILDRHASGETIRAICRTEGFPSDRTVRRWAYNDLDSFKARFHEAGRQFCQSLDEQCLEIADDTAGDYVLNPKTERMEFCYENVHRSKVRIETRQKNIARAWPERFSDRYAVSTEISGKDGGPLQVEHTDRDLARVILGVLSSAQLKDGETIDGDVAGKIAAGIGAPRGLFGAPAGVAEAELVADDSPVVEDEVDLSDFATDDLATVGDLSIEFIAGRTHTDARWWVLDRQGQRLTPITGTEAAKAASRAYAATGRIDVTKSGAGLSQTEPLKKVTPLKKSGYSADDLLAMPDQRPFPARQPRVLRSY